MDKVIKTKETGCPNCGGTMKYSPERQKLHCENCQTCRDIAFEIIEQKRDWKDKDKGTVDTKELAKSIKNLKCPNCGANVELGKLEYSKTCPYCESSLVGVGEDLLTVEPDGIIPFTFSDVEASKKYQAGIKKKFFAPNAFKKAPPVENIKGVYIPAFSFDANSVSKYSGRLASDESYTDSRGNRRSRTTYRNIMGVHTTKNIDVVVESSSKINQVQMGDILPYPMQKLVKFQQGFIMGYTVEQYENNVYECKMIAKRIMEENIKRQILSKYHYDKVVSFDMSTDWSEEKYMYYLLPIYKCDYKYKDKTYTTIMNGQTGKVGGGYPKSAFKIAMVIIFAVLLFLVPTILSFVI